LTSDAAPSNTAGAVTDLVPLLPDELAALLAEAGEPPYRGRQVFAWVHARRATSIDAMTDLPKALRAWLGTRCLVSRIEPVEVLSSADGTRKLLFDDGAGGLYNSVIMPSPDRVTLCISSQVGCRMACGFCLTGCMRFRRNLTAAEIAGQVLAAARILDAEGAVPEPAHREAERIRSGSQERGAGRSERSWNLRDATVGVPATPEPPGGARRSGTGAGPAPGGPQPGRTRPAHVSNVVFMGMGEPLDNFDEVVRAVRLITHREGLRVAPRRTTVSTVGLLPEMRRFLEAGTGASLALSLCATTDEVRSRVVPASRRYPLDAVVDALRGMPLPHGHSYTIEYQLIPGVGASVEDARRLSRMLSLFPNKVNLIPFNPWPGAPFREPTPAEVEAFRAVLAEKHHRVTVRWSRGRDIGAACGQLGGGERRGPEGGETR